MIMSALETLFQGVTLAHPWCLVLLPLPFLVRLLPPYYAAKDAIQAPFFERLLLATEAPRRLGAGIRERGFVQRLLLVTLWCALVIAGAQPHWLGSPIEQQRAGRDLMIAVDLSGSMETEDFIQPDGSPSNRLDAVRAVLQRLVEERQGDRLGLIVFGSAAYLQAPFTEDHKVWQQLLDEARIRMAGPSTVLGDAVGLAIKLFEQSTTDQRVLLLLTDGNDTGSVVPPIDAARVAAARDIRIYPIAVGDPAAVGEQAIDTQILSRMAEVTGGQSFIALDRVALNNIFSLLQELEPSVFDSVSYRPRTDLHWLSIALWLLLYTGLRTATLLSNRSQRA
jgi:Ca-activated chloride channel family protein